MNKPTFKGESMVKEKIRLPFGDIEMTMNAYGSYEISVSIEESHIVKHYIINQRPDNTLSKLTIIIKEN